MRTPSSVKRGTLPEGFFLSMMACLCLHAIQAAGAAPEGGLELRGDVPPVPADIEPADVEPATEVPPPRTPSAVESPTEVFSGPLVGAATRLHTSSAKVQARDATAEAGVADFDRFQAPTRGYAEQCFFLDMKPSAEGDATACLFNPTLGTRGVGAYVRYDTKALPRFTEWKMMGEQEYVVGLEPGTWTVQGRAEARRRGELRMLQPCESQEFRVEIGVVEGEEELKALLG